MTENVLGEKLRPVVTDSIEWMRYIAKVANIELGRIRRMVLVLDVEDMPRLFTECFLQKAEGSPPALPSLEVHADVPVLVDTTSIQNNEHWKTKAIIERSKK